MNSIRTAAILVALATSACSAGTVSPSAASAPSRARLIDRRVNRLASAEQVRHSARRSIHIRSSCRGVGGRLIQLGRDLLPPVPKA